MVAPSYVYDWAFGQAREARHLQARLALMTRYERLVWAHEQGRANWTVHQDHVYELSLSDHSVGPMPSRDSSTCSPSCSAGHTYVPPCAVADLGPVGCAVQTCPCRTEAQRQGGV